MSGYSIGTSPHARFDHILEGLCRKVSEPVDAVAGTPENPALGVPCELLARHPGVCRIGGCDPAGPGLCEGVKNCSAGRHECHRKGYMCESARVALLQLGDRWNTGRSSSPLCRSLECFKLACDDSVEFRW